VATARNVLKLPNTALRYKPPMAPEQVLAVYKQYGIEGGEQKQAGSESPAVDSGTQTDAANKNLPRAPKSVTAVVWKLRADNSTEPVKVSLGITDHSYTEVTAVLKGTLNEGDELVIRSVVPKSQGLGGMRP